VVLMVMWETGALVMTVEVVETAVVVMTLCNDGGSSRY
jgi:hypothetical protein